MLTLVKIESQVLKEENSRKASEEVSTTEFRIHSVVETAAAATDGLNRGLVFETAAAVEAAAAGGDNRGMMEA